MTRRPRTMRSYQRRVLRRPFSIERLESRHTLSDEEVLWDNAANLTVSFAPDHTPIGQHESSLFAKFGPDQTASWQGAIFRAFQTWAQHSNINFGLVTDSGTPFGDRGLATSDVRFGDVRIGAIPLSAETLAVSVATDQGVAGTWAGDWLFNSLGTFASEEDVFKVALHEIGHVLGLAHSPDPLSPMFQHTANIHSQLTTDDIAAVQQRYGLRQPDRWDADSPNDSIDNATRIAGTDDHEEFGAEFPFLEFGDLSTLSDVDVFELPIPKRYGGNVTWQVRSSEISLLQPRLTLLDRTGQVLAQADGHDVGGDVLSLTLNQVTPDEKYYAQIERASDAQYPIGAYVLVVTLDDRISFDLASLPEVVREARRFSAFDDDVLDSEDYRQLFLGNFDHPVDDDSHTDDDVAEARELTPAVSTAQLVKYQVVTSTTDAVDVDVFRVEAPKLESAGPLHLHVSLESFELDSAISTVAVSDRNGVRLPVTLLANGDGLQVLQLENVSAGRDYYISVSTTGADGVPRTGNFRLSATFDFTRFTWPQATTGVLSSGQPEIEYRLYVAKTQLFSFALESSTTSIPDSIIWLTIYDAEQKPLYSLSSNVGTLRSAPSILLDPGEYFVQIGAQAVGSAALPEIAFTAWRKQVSDPIGPPVLDPTQTPIYVCPGIPNSYCYPGSVTSPQPAVVVTSPILVLPTLTSIPISIPLNNWYWKFPLLRSNPTMSQDVNADGLVSSIDVLMIINDLNANGARPVPPPPVVLPYVDVNNDGFITPLDVLIVINHFNQGVGEGEGHSSVLPHLFQGFEPTITSILPARPLRRSRIV